MSSFELDYRQKLVLKILAKEKKSFSELLDQLKREMSKETLSKNLQILTRKKLIQRIVDPNSRPPRVFYKLYFPLEEVEPEKFVPVTYGKGYIDRFFIIHINVLNMDGDTEVIKHITMESINEPIEKESHEIGYREFEMKFEDLKVDVLSSWGRTAKIGKIYDLDPRKKRFEVVFDPPIRPGEFYTYGVKWFWSRIYPVESNYYHLYVTAPLQVLFWDITLQRGLKGVKITRFDVKLKGKNLPCEEPTKFRCEDRWKIHWTVTDPPMDSVCTLSWLPFM